MVPALHGAYILAPAAGLKAAHALRNHKWTGTGAGDLSATLPPVRRTGPGQIIVGEEYIWDLGTHGTRKD